MIRRSRVVIIVGALLFLTSSSVCAEEEIGLMQRLWRKLFKTPVTEQKSSGNPILPEQRSPAVDKAKNPGEEKMISAENTTGFGTEELQELQEHKEQLIREQQERENLEILRRIRREQAARQLPERPPR